MAELQSLRRSTRNRESTTTYADTCSTEVADHNTAPKSRKENQNGSETTEEYDTGIRSDDECIGTETRKSNNRRAKSSAKSKRKSTSDDQPGELKRLTVTSGIVRPRGERQPPLIWDVPKKLKDPNAPPLLALKVTKFDADRNRAKSKIPRLAPGEEEVRLEKYLTYPPEAYHTFLERATTQRMYVLERYRDVEEDCHANHSNCPHEQVTIAGSSGNVYQVTITHRPTCTCPEAIFRKSMCKHILYVLHFVLKAPQHLRYQSAFLVSELKQIAGNAPALPSLVAEVVNQDGHRKAVEDDCPICCMEFEEAEDVVWCTAACGNNIHKTCFDQWARTKLANQVTCPFCRTLWQDSTLPKGQKVNMVDVKMPVQRNRNGYYNIRDQLDYE